MQSGWSSAICFANGPDIFEILMTTAIQVWWWILQPGQPPHPEQTGPERFYRAITILGYLCKWSRSSGLMQSGHSRAKYFTNNPNWPASCKEYSHIQHLCWNSSGSFCFVSFFQRGRGKLLDVLIIIQNKSMKDVNRCSLCLFKNLCGQSNPNLQLLICDARVSECPS